MDRPGLLDDLSHAECQHFSFEIPTDQKVPLLTTEIAQHFVMDQIPRIATMANSSTDPADKAAEEAATLAKRQEEYGDISDEDYSMIQNGVMTSFGPVPSLVPVQHYKTKATSTKIVPVVLKTSEGLPIEVKQVKVLLKREVLPKNLRGFQAPLASIGW